jgi:hypothetical protein
VGSRGVIRIAVKAVDRRGRNQGLEVAAERAAEMIRQMGIGDTSSYLDDIRGLIIVQAHDYKSLKTLNDALIRFDLVKLTLKELEEIGIDYEGSL